MNRRTAELDEAATEWLMASDEPGIAMQARRDVAGRDQPTPSSRILSGPIASRLLSGQQSDGGFGVQPYQKWTGAHWRLVSLVELGATAADGRVKAALESVLEWIAADGEPTDAPRIRDRYRVHGSIYANVLAVATRLGSADDRRARNIAASLVLWQWPDGGWNCDRRPAVRHSSFYESITPLWALAEFSKATGDRDAANAAARAADFFLRHRVFKSHSTDAPGDPKWLKLRYPEYWHFDYLHGLVMLMRAGALPDRRADDALVLLRSQQQPDGRWMPAGPQYWRGTSGLYGDPAGWNAELAGRMLTLNALRVLRIAGA